MFKSHQNALQIKRALESMRDLDSKDVQGILNQFIIKIVKFLHKLSII